MSLSLARLSDCAHLSLFLFFFVPGDIDPLWIESLNTVMDDNKVLTLASNERIALTKEMRLLFEVGGLQSATPATVSRGKLLFNAKNKLETHDFNIPETHFICSWHFICK